MLDPIERKNLSDVVIAKIRQYIVGNALGPGDRLPTEQEFADRFGVSRISVREATRALGFLGILDAAPGRGLTVGKVDMERVTDYLGFHLALNDYSRTQLLETRIVIETGALPYVMQRMADDAAVYERLDAMTDELRKTRNPSKRIQGDIAFHRTLIESSGLEPLAAFNGLLQIFFDRFRRSVARADWDAGIAGHQRILEALRQGRIKSAIHEMRSHLDYHRESVRPNNKKAKTT